MPARASFARTSARDNPSSACASAHFCPIVGPRGSPVLRASERAVCKQTRPDPSKRWLEDLQPGRVKRRTPIDGQPRQAWSRLFPTNKHTSKHTNTLSQCCKQTNRQNIPTTTARRQQQQQSPRSKSGPSAIELPSS
jgi:hypothetical protein